MDDMISRQAAIDRATKEHDFFRGAVTVSDKARRDELLNVMCWLGELPSAQPKRIKGHWVDDCTYMGIQCSVCGKSLQDYIHATEYAELMEVPNYCLNCGADMREVTT